MILTYSSYLDQTQIIGSNTILDYHRGYPTPYPLNIALSHSVEYNIALSHSVEYNIALSQSGGGS